VRREVLRDVAGQRLLKFWIASHVRVRAKLPVSTIAGLEEFWVGQKLTGRNDQCLGVLRFRVAFY
jgi:hypothetical protein